MRFIKRLYFKQVAVILVFTFFVIGSVPKSAMAFVAGADATVSTATRAADMASVQRVLESKLVASKLIKAGLTPDEVKSRLDKLSDKELHQFASQLNSLYPGGDFEVIIALLVIAILVIVMLKLLGHKIIIQ